MSIKTDKPARRILLVEDDDLLRGSLSLLLEEEGYLVSSAASAGEALAAARVTAFDLVVTDVRMPGMSGISMLREMRQSAPDTRAVVITGFADFETPVEAFRLQVDDFLTKPFDEATFLQAVQRAMEWLDRQAWWRASLERSYRDSLGLWEGTLLDLAPDREATLRRRALSRRLGLRQGLRGEELEALEWAALLAPLNGSELLGRCRELLAADPAERKGWERRSVLHLVERALTQPGSEELLSLVSRFDALAHPADAALGLSRAECLEVLRRDSPGPLLEHFEEVLAGREAEAEEARPTGPAVLALAASALAAGQPELAREALEPLEHPPVPARLCLAAALLACGQPESAREQAQLALKQAGGSLDRADSLALLGAARLAAGEPEGEGELTRAAELFAGQGAARGTVRTGLLRAWGQALGGSRPDLEGLLDHVEAQGLEWVLGRERWLAVEVLRRGAGARARDWLARLLPGQEVAAPALEVEGLGPLRLRAHGRDLKAADFKTSKSQALLLVLLLHGGTEVPDERLTDLFWGELEGDRAQANLYSALTYIRKAVGENDVVQHQRGRCRFNPDVPHRVDFLEFERQVSIGLARRAPTSLQAAVELYRGDLLENLPDDWVRPYRRRLRELAVRALEVMLELAAGQDARCLSLAEQLLSIDRCHQGAYQELMRLWSRAGQPERVTRLYWACQEALEQELHMAPSAETTRLFQELTADSRLSQGSLQ